MTFSKYSIIVIYRPEENFKKYLGDVKIMLSICNYYTLEKVLSFDGSTPAYGFNF